MEEGEIESDNSNSEDEQMLENPDGMEPGVESSAPPTEATEEKSEGKQPQQQPSNIKRLITPSEIQQIKSIYCSGLPEELNTKEKLKVYFSEFGEVIRVYMSLKKMACTVHYKDHKSAAHAKKYGGVFGTKRFGIFWCQSSSSKSTKSPTATKREEVETETVEQEKKAKEVPSSGGSKMPLRRAARRKVSEPSSSTNKVDEDKPAKQPRARGGKRKEKADHALSTSSVDVVFSKTASMKDLQEVLIKPAKTAEEKYRVLEARDKLIRMEREMQQKKLGVAGRLIGTCPDMCPEKERYLRESQRQVHSYELKQIKEYSMNHCAAIKQYSRSSADQEEPLPHDLRPSKVLMMSMNYMVCNIMDLSESKEDNLRDWYFYVWDRTRAIRKDITQQQLCDMSAVLLVEQCARFHIHCAERLVAEDLTVFDEKINNENLTKCLQTLKHLYHDLAMKGEFCPNEAEFRGYIILMNLGDGNFMWEVQDLRPEIQKSVPVRFAVQVYFALSSGNYVRFFKLVKCATYLNACLMHRYFNQVRTKALAAIARSFTVPSKIAQFPLLDIVNLLKFESVQQGEMFCEHHGLELDQARNFVCLGRSTLLPANSVFPVTRAINVIESKRNCSIGEVIVGGKIVENLYESHIPHNSFTESGMLKNESWNALDQGEGVSVVEVPKKVETEPEVDKEHLIEELTLPIVEEIIQEEVGLEVKQISRDFLDYLNKISIAFLSMYCETFVLDFVRDICSTTLKEMKNEKIQAEREAQELKKMYEDLINKSADEANSSLLDEVVKTMCRVEASSVLTAEREKERAAKEITKDMVDEVTECMTEELAEEIIESAREDRTRRLQSLTKAVKQVTLRHYFHEFVKSFEKKKQLKIAMQGFPAWISSMSLDEQVKWFGSSCTRDIKPIKRRWSTAFEHGFNISTQTFPLVSVEEILQKSLLGSIRKSGSLRNELDCLLKWNVIVSIPDNWNGKKDTQEVEEWLNRCFIPVSSERTCDEPLFQLEKKISHVLSLNICIDEVIGHGCSRFQTLNQCMSGCVFILQGCRNSMYSESSRLNNILVKNKNYQVCPLAVLCVRMEELTTDELVKVLALDSLVQRKLISRYSVFSVDKKNGGLAHVQLENSLHWLAGNVEFPPPLDVRPLEILLQNVLLEEFWVSLVSRAQENEILEVALQDPNDIISMYNAAVEVLAEACCSRNYLGLIGVPDSRVEALNQDYLSHFRNIKNHWFTQNYLADIRRIIESAKLPRIHSLPAEDFMELSIIMQDYCASITKNPKDMARAFSVSMKLLEHGLYHKIRSRSLRIQKSYNSPWPSIIKVLAEVNLRSMNFADSLDDQRSRSLIINSDVKNIIDSKNGLWWMKTSVILGLFEEIEMEKSREMPKLDDADGLNETSPKKDNLWDLKKSLEKLTSDLSKQSSKFSKLNSDIETSMNLGH